MPVKNIQHFDRLSFSEFIILDKTNQNYLPINTIINIIVIQYFIQLCKMTQ